jgi:hypothetical protein
MRSLLAPLELVRARARRRPGLWLLPALGLALAGAFAAAVAAEGTLAGDQSARAALAGLAPLDRTVRVTWTGPLSAAERRRIASALRGLHLGPRARVVLLDPVRLGGVVVRPAAIAPLGPWLASAGARLGPCRPGRCQMLFAGPGRVPATLAAPAVRIRVIGAARLDSAVPLGFVSSSSDGPPVLLTDDVGGLGSLGGLSGVYRTSSTLAPLQAAGLHSWELPALETRLGRSQAAVAQLGSQFTLEGPFAGLDAARAQAGAAPRRLLLAGGAAVTALILFVILAGAALRRDQLAELRRLGNAGAREGQAAAFVVAESAWIAAVGLSAGAALGIAAAAVLAAGAGAPVGAVLTHSVIGWRGAAALVAAWVAATVLLVLPVVLRRPGVVDAIAVAAAAALVAALVVGPGGGSSLAVLVAPLCCLAAGVLVLRGAGLGLRASERAIRRGPIPVRLAIVGLARDPALPSLAVAFVAVSVGLGGFALGYRATLARGAADEAAARVPLDALVAPGLDFNPPLDLAPLARWRALAGGPVLPVRRTDANYLAGSGTATVPALGVPAAQLALIHGWRASDGSASLPALARRLEPGGPVRSPGPTLAGATWLSVRSASPALTLSVTADLRAPSGAIRQLPLGVAGAPGWLRARVPPGRFELAAFELDEPTGLELTNGHQNGENIAAQTQQRVRLTLGPLLITPGNGRPPVEQTIGDWRGVGAASALGGRAGVELAFQTTGTPGVVRPPQPSDTLPVPVLVDPATAAAATGGLLALTIDGLPVHARVVGTIRRFPTIGAGAGGAVVADQATLAGALDAQLPGQGRPDELWVSTPRPAALRGALRTPPLNQLSWSFRSDIQRRLASAPIASGVERTLLTAGLLWAALAVLGLLATLLGPGRDRALERDLEAQGVGPRAIVWQARFRLGVAGVAGVAAGVAIAAVLTRLAVASVQAATTIAPPQPALVTVVPLGLLAAWAVAVLAAVAVGALLAR